MKSILAIMLVALAISNCALGDTFGSGPNTFDIEFVTIGHAGNLADTTGEPSPVGAVGYEYRIGKLEISRDMIYKANSANGLGITLSDMTTAGGNGINRPATGVSWNEAARFINWLNTSQGFPPAYKFSTQPGQEGYIANQDISLWVPGDPGFNATNQFRNSQAHYFLPNADEWYKAAFYAPTSGSYKNFPTGSDTAPTSVANGTATGTAVYKQTFSTGPADISVAGGLSSYGTMAQGGNVSEWEETEYDLVNNSVSSARGLRGGSWSDSVSELLSSSLRTSVTPPSGKVSEFGFRVASSLIKSTLIWDYNTNGAVDAADYVVWRNGDSPDDTQTGYNLWKANFGKPTGSGSSLSAVPEPSTLILTIAALAALSNCRCKPVFLLNT
jgi:sulfatase modifying factor 1